MTKMGQNSMTIDTRVENFLVNEQYLIVRLDTDCWS